MNKEFWQEKWTQKELGFHRSAPNPLLVKNFHRLSMPQGSRVFLPLCGKTRDISWLLSRGYSVVGSELVATAIDQLFAELDIVPKITPVAELLHYRAPAIDIYVGDIFELEGQTLGPIDATYDRAALVALPEPMRARYTDHLIAISEAAPQLLITFDYDQALLEGPPFAVNKAEVERHYVRCYHLGLVSRTSVEGGLKGQCSAEELVWVLDRPDL